MKETDIMWQGFVQMGVYSNDYPPTIQEHEIPVHCPLSALENIDADTTDHGIVTFAQLLETYIFSKLTNAGITITTFYIQGTPTVTRAQLDIKVMWTNFLDTDSEGNVNTKYNCLELLEEVCKFFGWTCRMQGTCIYFTSMGNPAAATDFSEYTSLLTTGTAGTTATKTLTISMVGSDDNTEEVHPGIRRVTVKSDINEIDNLLEIPYEELYDKYNTGQIAIETHSVDYYSHEVYRLISVPNRNNSNLEYENETLYMKLHTADVTTEDAMKYARFYVYDDQDVGSQDKRAYSWKKCIDLFHSYSYAGSDNQTMMILRSKQTFIVSNGYLYVNFRVDEVSEWLGQNIAYTASLKIGNKYWNGSAWTTTSSTFTLYFGSNGAKMTRTNINDPQYEGSGIPVTSTLKGIIEFCIIDVPAWVRPLSGNINGFLPLMNFKIGFVRGSLTDERHHGNTFTMDGGEFRDETSVDLIYASDKTYGVSQKMKAGKGYILNNSTEIPLEQISTPSGLQVPEEYLATIISNYGKNQHRCLVMEYRTDMLGNLYPHDKVSESGYTMNAISINHDWREDISKVTLIEI